MTMLLVIASASAIYAAADSKQFPSGNITEKIFAVGRDAVIMNAGFAFIPKAGENGNDWDARVEIGKLAASIPDGAPEQQFNFLRNRVLENFSQAIARYHGEIPTGKSLDFFFVRRIAAKNYGWFQKILVQEAEPRIYQASLDSPKRFDTGVYWSLPLECIMHNFRIDQIISVAAISDLFHRVAGQSEACSRQIGDPIRVTIIDDDAGVRWLQ